MPNCFYFFRRLKIKHIAVDCQQLKRTGARSAGRTAACNDFILTACVCNMTMWGEPGMLSWTWAESEIAMGCVAKIWEEDNSMLSSV
jgi:hypothetical protein